MTTVLGLETALHRGLDHCTVWPWFCQQHHRPGSLGGGSPTVLRSRSRDLTEVLRGPRCGPGTGSSSSAVTPTPWEDAELDVTQGPGSLCGCPRVQQRHLSILFRRGTRTKTKKAHTGCAGEAEKSR